MMYFEEALRVLLANKVRSLLTVTGLIIGVGAVIAIQVLGAGMSGAVGGVLGGISDRSFFLSPNVRQADFTKAALHLRDLTAVQNFVPNVAEAVPVSSLTEVAHVGHSHTRGLLFAVPAERYEGTPFEYGHMFSALEVAQGENLCVLSDKIYKKLFPQGGDPTGVSLHVGTHRYVISGVLAPPRVGILNANFGGDIALPYTTYIRDYLKGRIIFAAAFYVKDISQMAETEIAAIKYLKSIHKGTKQIEYVSFDRKTIGNAIDSIFTAITMVVALIGAVSLLVAGIGIMNIMLVSVTERTREIGVRKAIGARQNQILIQFFIEALLLCGIGCGIGLVIGLGIGYLVNAFALVKLSGTVTAIPWLQATLIAVGFATIVTLAFGTYPAYRAARLDPIEALRYE